MKNLHLNHQVLHEILIMSDVLKNKNIKYIEFLDNLRSAGIAAICYMINPLDNLVPLLTKVFFFLCILYMCHSKSIYWLNVLKSFDEFGPNKKSAQTAFCLVCVFFVYLRSRCLLVQNCLSFIDLCWPQSSVNSMNNDRKSIIENPVYRVHYSESIIQSLLLWINCESNIVSPL